MWLPPPLLQQLVRSLGESSSGCWAHDNEVSEAESSQLSETIKKPHALHQTNQLELSSSHLYRKIRLYEELLSWLILSIIFVSNVAQHQVSQSMCEHFYIFPISICNDRSLTNSTLMIFQETPGFTEILLYLIVFNLCIWKAHPNTSMSELVFCLHYSGLCTWKAAPTLKFRNQFYKVTYLF